MAILVDYRCDACGAQGEAFVASPAPAARPCPCGAESRRLFSPVGMIGARGDRAPASSSSEHGRTDAAARASGRHADAASAAGRAQPPGPGLCASNPDVPGLCHMSPTAGRAWVARARGDHRALDREFARQEKAAAEKPFTAADAVTHSH